MVIPFIVMVFGMVLVVSMVFCRVVAALMICSGVNVTGGVYRMGMLVLVNGLMVMVGGRFPVVL